MKFITVLLSVVFTFFWSGISAQTYSGYKVVDQATNMTISITVDPTADTVQIIMTGPDSVWYSFGFGGNTMSNLYSFIITGAGEITERKLGNHTAGVKLISFLKDSSYVSSGGMATAIVSRPVNGLNADYFDFPAAAVTFPIVWGVGVSSSLGYPHPNRGASTIKLTEDCIPTDSSFSAVSCDSYWSPGGKLLTSTGLYSDTLLNADGCDSILQIDLTILNSSLDTIQPVVCDSFISPAGNTWTISGLYMDTLVNHVGCDSIIVIDLHVNYSTSSSINEIACDEYVSPSGNHIWSQTGIYNDTTINSDGCDSIITVNLTINSSSSDTVSPQVCESYLSPGGNHIWTASGTYYDTLINSAGCDSFVTIMLTIDTADVSVGQINEVLTATSNLATFQWLDCDNAFTPIAGATSATFTATANGNYAVQVIQNTCTDTSSCYSVTTVGINTDWDPGVTLHPNPTQDNLFIDLQRSFKDVRVILMDVDGKVIDKTHAGTTDEVFMKMDVSSGVYIVKLITDQGSIMFRVVKQ
ncbi:MAG: T9SS type A sorting domain-containing protein [Chitinophagales bacterium]|nr:T9SS type A sorting domain-containing protein [Chitinophagales bacterium]